MWQLSKWNLEQVDYILGIYAGTIYGAYKLIKGSNEVIRKAYADQDKWDWWNQIHLNMGRPERYALDLDKVINEGNKTKTVLKLSPVTIPPTQFVLVPLNITDRDKKIGKELLNRTISDKKVKGRSGKYYFGEFK